tara:strand:+ start:1906 stop:2730 length:825 start_codon:yes stop_codon:yes gene_type:complete
LPFNNIPAVEIAPGCGIDEAEEKVCAVFEDADLGFASIPDINSRLPCADLCRFYESRVDGEVLISVVSIGCWEENETLNVLNILVGLRLNPYPRGRNVRLRFFSAEEVPSVLLLIGGDTVFGEFEARACLVARFGEDIRPENCQQMGAAGMHLVHSVLGTKVSLLASESPDALEGAVCDTLEREGQPVAEPLNSMILLGCLFGEIVRSQVELSSSWLPLPQFQPWPAVVFTRAEKSDGTDSVAFSPIAHIGSLLESRERGSLGRSLAELKSTCR